MPKALVIGLLIALILVVAQSAIAEISVSIDSVAPTDGKISDGESATISWKITADDESGAWQFEIGGDGTANSGEPASSSDASGGFGGTTQGTSTILSSDLTEGDGDYTVYFIAVDGDDSTIYDSTSTTITLDNPPPTVTGVTAGNGNAKLFLAWEELDVSDLNHYLVYYSTSSGTDASDYNGADSSDGASPIDVGNVTNYILGGLQNDIHYYVRVSAVDDTGTEGPLSQEAGNTPRESMGLTELVDEEGGCFIATAAYGDYDHPKVRILRKFRDNILQKWSFGRGFVKAYYKYSPGAAGLLAKRPRARFAAGVALIPLTEYARVSTAYPLLALLIPLLIILSATGSLYYAVARIRIRRRNK